MKLIEIRNNLIKLSYSDNERPTLGQFIALTGEEKSYVAQYVNLKADNVNNFAVAKLMFSFSQDGVVSEYDGSAPSINSNIVDLPAAELLNLLPVENHLKIGQIVGCPNFLDVDASIFEHNFTVFSENDFEKATIISNCVRQLFRMKEKSVIIDTDSIFEEYPKLEIANDFKLPLNIEFIDFIFEHDLKNVDVPTKAVIKDIFYAVQQYITTLDDEFLPIENFIDVVTAQYKETQMPELALLKNKLLKYKDAGIFANDADEFKILIEKLKERNCVVINIKDVSEDLQKYIINYVHKIIETFDKYVYFFVPLSDDNSDKKLVKRLINHNHVFTTVFASHNYKYASELKSHAQNIMLFAPQTMQNDFAAYNTFLNKLNPSEGIIYGKLTQGIPLIISLDDLDLDLTKEDVFGDRQRFVPAIEEDILSAESIYAINNLQEAPKHVSISEQDVNTKTDESADISSFVSDNEEDYDNSDIATEQYGDEEPVTAAGDKENSFETVDTEEFVNAVEEETEVPHEIESYESEEDEIEQELHTDPQIENILADETIDDETSVADETAIETKDDEDDLSFMDDFHSLDDSENSQRHEDSQTQDNEQLTEDDLDFIENSQNEIQNSEGDFSDEEFDDENFDNVQDTPVVPVYETEDEDIDSDISGANIGFKAGDQVTHPRYGNGVVEKIIKYGNKTLCSITFENVGRRLLDPSVSDFEKI